MGARSVTSQLDCSSGEGTLVAARVLAAEAPAVAAEWRELCRWDPELAPATAGGSAS